MEKDKKDKDILAKLKLELEKLAEQREIIKEQFQQVAGAMSVLEKLIKDA